MSTSIVITLRSDECTSAAAIQAAIDRLALAGGGILQLPELDLTLDRGLELRAGVEVRGSGRNTILRKGPSRVYPLSGYHNYGMRDVPLESAEGLEAGMTVTVFDDKRRWFNATFARITWIDGSWVGLDQGLESDYTAAEHPRLVTTFPLVFGQGIRRSALRDVTLEGNLAANPYVIDGCRNGAVYFADAHEIEVTGVQESGFNGEGLSFQMCSRMTIRDCTFSHNTGNGLHPGAGSTDIRFENCRSEGNGAYGLFFCVRANHITTRGCTFAGNTEAGVSIGTRDCFNLIEDCDIVNNGGPGISVRPDPKPVEVHACTVRECRISQNARTWGRAQIEIAGDACDIVIEKSMLDGGGRTLGVLTTERVGAVFLDQNIMLNCEAETQGEGFTTRRPGFACGADACGPDDYRHLAIN